MIFWIASYPKSGNTWLRSLLCAYYYSSDGNFNQKLLKNISQFPQKHHFANFDYNPKIVTDTSRFWIKAQNEINRDRKLKFFKTHNILGAINNNNFTNKENSIGGIYLVRDPRNIITSLQNHFELNKDEALKFMLSEKKYLYDYNQANDFSDFQFISSWEKNYKSWTKQDIFPIKVIKYEELMNNTFETFKEIILFIEKITKIKKIFIESKAKNSIESTSFNKMKKIEQSKGFNESVLSKNDSKKIPFFHLGPKNDWKKILNEDFIKNATLKFKPLLTELNYI
tara:strand:- start:266 stop:1114 length:849 start_codon:yes stop_codon:yes gene_type:complete